MYNHNNNMYLYKTILVIVLLFIYLLEMNTLLLLFLNNNIDFSGQIYNKNIEYALPYKTPLYKITITGSTLKKVLEQSAYIYDYKDCAMPDKNIFGGFIQMSGEQ